MKTYFAQRFFTILILALCIANHFALGQVNSTQEDRDRVVAITQKLEKAPLDKSLRNEREWAVKRMIDVQDIHVPLCPAILGNDYFNSNYKYKGEITAQLLLASASFVIQNQGKPNDQQAMNQSALESVLKAYRGILKEKPKDKSRGLDLLLQKQDAGQLTEYLKGIGNNCGSMSH